jgi:cyanophycin synthetase
MRLVEIRLLDGPNLYRLEPTVKVEVVVGRRRTWYGVRDPGRHAVVRLGTPVPASHAPPPARAIAAWIRRLASATPVDPDAPPPPVTLHRTSEPGHWIVAFPWRERGRAEAIAEAAFRFSLAGLDPSPRRRSRAEQRRVGRAVERIAAAGTDPPTWIRDSERRVPTVSITGTNGKSTTTRMITRILRAAGRHTGTAVSDGVLLDGSMVEEGDLTGPAGARMVLTDARVEVAVLETARGGLLLRGLGYESNDASVITNISSDHLDLQGIHTLPELAEVKSIVARVTRPLGTVVLNAADPLVADIARRARGRVCLFAVEPLRAPARARLARHARNGGASVVVEGGWIVERSGGTSAPIVLVEEIPATLGGAARHNVANALAATAAARALGVSPEQVADGLRGFQPTADVMPGRMNLYRDGGRLVIVDFAHNEAGLSAMLDAARTIIERAGPEAAGAWISVVVGTAGDRPDDTLRALGRIAGERADGVSIKEVRRYLRGRTRESLVGEILAGLADAGVDPADVPVYPDEPSAARGELTTAGRIAAGPGPGVLLLMVHADRVRVVSALLEAGFEPLSGSDLANPLGR